jgi:RimJ/RimL family protein N-acetyltransferase
MIPDSAVTLRPATGEDRFRIRRWLSSPAALAWWSTASTVEAEISLAIGSSAALCRMAENGSKPVAYAQAVETGLWNEERSPEVVPGTWHLAYLPASEEADATGTASAVLALLAEEVFATTLALACSATVSVTNEAAARACERAGFRWQRIWSDRLLGPSWLMLKQRPR